jgi:GNAT superfamily N-acetyltransferase
MSAFSVRSARPADLAAAAELRWLWAEQIHGTPDMPLDAFTAEFVGWAERHPATHHCFVAASGDAVVGMAWLAVTSRVPHPGAVERASGDVQCVYVLPEHRGGGLGGRLVDAVLDRDAIR